MTNPSIPPCPKCGTVPTLIMYGGKFPFVSGVCQCLSDANLIGNSDRTYPVCWENGVDILLGRACRELGIETVEQLKARLAPDPRVAVLEKKLAKLTDKLAMVEQESEQRLSAIIGYSDQLLAMKEKYEPVPQSGPHPDGCFSSDPNDVADCESDGHYSCKDCKRNSRIAAQRGEG